MQDGIFPLSPIDHVASRVHTVKILYFPVPDANATLAVAKLKSSLKRTFDALPILSGSVQEGKHPPRAGSLCVSEPWNTVDDIFRVNDLTQSGLDYTSLRKQHFPLEALVDYDIVSRSLPHPLEARTPVMIVQVNLVRNGMILAIALHHSCMDGTGFVGVTEIWAKFCRGEDGAELLRDGTLTEQRLMHGDEGGRLSDFPGYFHIPMSLRNGAANGNMAPTEKASASADPRATLSGPQQPTKIDGQIFFFSRSKLMALKSKVSASLPETNGDSNGSQSPSYISTNDALCAFIFACVTQARTPPESTGLTRTIPFLFAVSVRRLLDIPKPAGYIGNMVVLGYLDFPLCTVTCEIGNIASVAQRIRKRINDIDGGYVKRLIGAIGAVEDSREVVSGYHAPKDYPFVVTTWTQQGFYDMEWGSEIGVGCERVRVLREKTPSRRRDGTIVVMPELKARDDEEGGLEVLVCLEEGVMQQLRDLEEWRTWAEWRCS